jgi:protein tyrosine/serine phosphatase
VRRLWAWAGLAALALAQAGCARLIYNFGTVEPGRIYRSAQPSPLLLRWLVSGEPGLRTLVNLRGETPGFESAFAARHGLRLFSFDFSASTPPSEAEVQRLLAVLQDPANYPLLIHCRNGVDRTGFGVALYRLRAQRWELERALREMGLYLQFEPLNPVPRAVVRDGLRSPGS